MTADRSRLLEMPLYAAINDAATRADSWDPAAVFAAMDPVDVDVMWLTKDSVRAAILRLNDPAAWRLLLQRRRRANRAPGRTREELLAADRDRKRRARAAMSDQERELVRRRDRERKARLRAIENGILDDRARRLDRERRAKRQQREALT